MTGVPVRSPNFGWRGAWGNYRARSSRITRWL